MAAVQLAGVSSGGSAARQVLVGIGSGFVSASPATVFRVRAVGGGLMDPGLPVAVPRVAVVSVGLPVAVARVSVLHAQIAGIPDV